MFNFFRSNNDVDPKETYDWILSIESVIREEGMDRAKFLLDKITRKVYGEKFSFRKNVSSYINTISSNEESQYPGNLEIERRIRSIIRWNAIMIVLRASKKNLDLGGHISSFQSCATIYDVCFNHFFQGREEKNGGDLVYFQGHVSPGIYSRAFLEERLTEEQLDNFRQETGETSGLSSYPHPRLMPEFWQFPTVSMGLGAISAIYQAKFLKYLEYRSLKCTSTRKVYVFLGDGEMDEPESKGALTVAAREKLDNLIFIINCNLQRLDGPVFGNGKIINELEGVFRGSGWEVIKVIWGGAWDSLLKKDITGKLVKLMNETIDGDYQRLSSFGASYIRKNFFGKYKETLSLIQDMSDEEILMLNRGGHDSKKIFSALNKAHSVVGKPVVILMHTIKGYGLSDIAEGMNIAHQVKQIDVYGLRKFRDRFNLHDVVSDQDILSLSYVKLAKSSKEYAYLRNCRKVLHGFVPIRLNKFTNLLELPKLDCFNSLLYGKGRKFSTTMAFVRILNILLSDGCIKKRIVPIIADEARTFGMEGLFKKVGIYSSCGQKYTPQDREKLIYYKEDKSGQILQEGISELGAFSSWLAAATSYSTSNFLMIPFYVFYSMFGFQRIGDLCWAAGDQQARGFLIGGTSGRTTLNGEGLQHGDGHSHIYSLTIPNCVSYNPAYAYELAVIIHNGIHRMYGENSENIYYYITTLNENYCMPDIPKFSEEGICKGIYKLEEFVGNVEKVQLLGSGSILQHVREAAKVLLKDYNISSDVYSVTSFSELARNAQDCERWNMLHPTEVPKVSYIRKVMNNAPIVVSTDYMKIFAEQIGKFVPTNLFYVLGTDGFGRSDSRRKLRRYFEIDTSYIVIASLYVLVKFGSINSDILVSAINRFKIDIDKINPRLL
ncbi:Pyruvate dehydrogenase E1 component [Candidatus Westeberhardia cardiocondylae]|uniref:Pyruvate dehydrogenase E1 component n=1 Tax=Candidatus Westeberhardia cardiocondylae TaxID=1594731 RepID=A0A0H5BWP6_9ENTR|nr:pyruvate dehydrogenase (acetyl-transferring), homodimeric type [Candidatus Westeberhardia cardiocondylae]CEN32093.1 Pyruvate dehydrogenase E1 component [Candidatus Westeberhardia cardiocondylae]